jgi:site-specific recombinase
MSGAIAIPLAPTEADLPDADAFGALLAPGSARHTAVRQLHAVLSKCDPSASHEQRVEALEELFRWFRSRRAAPATASSLPGERAEIARLRLLVHALEAVPAARVRLSATLAETLTECRAAGLFAASGIPTDRGFFAETVDRMSRRFLPEPRDDYDLVQVVLRLLPGAGALRAVAAIPPELLERLVRALAPGGGDRTDAWAPFRPIRSDAMAILATRISAVGLSDVLRARSPVCRLDQSPFYRLPREIDVLRAAFAAGNVRADLVEHYRAVSDECREVVARVIENLENAGVSVDVVYRLELITKSLHRLDALVGLIEPVSDLEQAMRAKALVVELLDLRLRDHRLREILNNNLHLLARKVIERAGHTGEHYITSSRGEYAKMLFSAGGGGVLTAGTTALKFVVGSLKAPPFVDGVLSSMNYAGSFLLMQFCGFTLATKQPSVTAAALAGTLRETAHHPDLSALVSMIARITRSQLAAAIGNVGMVIPAALLFDYYWRARFGAHFLDEDTAHYALHSLHPTETGTVFFAALTGVLLWASSIAAGWLENWAVYRRLPDAIAQHWMGRFIGRRTMGWVSRLFARNVSGFGGNVTLGVLLAMTPVMGKFFGLPLEVRHVTLSTGALTLGVASLGSAADVHAVLPAALGIAIIGFLNFGVSFVLALTVALRARQVERSDRWRLLVSVLATFLRSPLQFFVPPRHPEVQKVHGPVSIPPPQPH